MFIWNISQPSNSNLSDPSLSHRPASLHRCAAAPPPGITCPRATFRSTKTARHVRRHLNGHLGHANQGHVYSGGAKGTIN